MILNPHTVFHAGTVPIELERAAEAYDAAAGGCAECSPGCPTTWGARPCGGRQLGLHGQ